jgi:hypothetical protein
MPVTFQVNSFGEQSDADLADGACAAADGKCTLRAALEQADRAGRELGTVRINIPSGTYPVSRQLTYDYSKNPPCVSGTDGSVELVGDSQGQTLIDGQNLTRVFYLRTQTGLCSAGPKAGQPCRTDYRYGSPDDCGGVGTCNAVADPGRVTIRDLTITRGHDERAYDPNNMDRPGFGGAIFVDGLLELERVTLRNSVAKEGGGLYVDFGRKPTAQLPDPFHPIAVLTSVRVLDNQSTTTRFGFGGGGIANGSELFASDLHVLRNTAASQGAGFYDNSWYWAELQQFEVSDNIAKSDAGGIQVDIGKMRLVDGIVAGNRTQCCRPDGSSPGGAGLFNYGLNESGLLDPGIMILDRVLVKDNVAEGVGSAGGGIYNWGTMTLRNVTVTGNRSGYGGGIYLGDGTYAGSSLDMLNTTVSGNVAQSQPPLNSEGGGIFARSGNLTAQHCTITANDGLLVGGIATRPKATVSLYGTILAQNTAEWASDCGADSNAGAAPGRILSAGYNVIGNREGRAPHSCSVTLSPNDRAGTFATPLDARLHGLTGDGPSGFGGEMPSHPLRPGSPAIDRATGLRCPSGDAVGVARPKGAACDSGAREDDSIFADDFETGDLRKWGSVSTKDGKLRVSAPAARDGSYGLLFDVAQLPPPARRAKLWVKDSTPTGLKSYRARFSLNLDTLAVETSPRVLRLMAGRIAGNPSRRPFEIRLRFDAGEWWLFGLIRSNVGSDGKEESYSTWPIRVPKPGWSTVEIEWHAGDAAGAPGWMSIALDAAIRYSPSVYNDTIEIDGVQVGFLGGLGLNSTGRVFIDGFESREQSSFPPR